LDFQLGCCRVSGDRQEQKGCSCKTVRHDSARYRRAGPVHSWSLGGQFT
jgi:hypothetical protein